MASHDYDRSRIPVHVTSLRAGQPLAPLMPRCMRVLRISNGFRPEYRGLTIMVIVNGRARCDRSGTGRLDPSYTAIAAKLESACARSPRR